MLAAAQNRENVPNFSREGSHARPRTDILQLRIPDYRRAIQVYLQIESVCLFSEESDSRELELGRRVELEFLLLGKEGIVDKLNYTCADDIWIGLKDLFKIYFLFLSL